MPSHKRSRASGFPQLATHKPFGGTKLPQTTTSLYLLCLKFSCARKNLPDVPRTHAETRALVGRSRRQATQRVHKETGIVRVLPLSCSYRQTVDEAFLGFGRPKETSRQPESIYDRIRKVCRDRIQERTLPMGSDPLVFPFYR